MKKFILKFWPLFFIFLVWFIFSSPFFLKGLVPFPSDYLSNVFPPWSAYETYVGPVKNGATPDVITQIYPWKKLVIDIWREGSVPLWSPYEFSGTPLLANYQSGALSPFNILYFIFSFVDAWSIQILLQPLLAGIFTYPFMRSLNLGKSASLISSLAFMFCGFITTWMDYGTLGYAILFLPLALLAIEKFYQTRKWYYSILLSMSIPLSFFSGHFQISLYFLIFVLAFSLFKFIQQRDFRFFILNLISVFLGFLICLPQLLPSIELYMQSFRSGLFMKSEVIPWVYIPTFIAPDFLGNPVTRNDWFGHYAEWNSYIGLVPIILGFFSLRKRNSYINFFLLTSLVVIFLAFQTPLLDLLIELKVPVLSTSAASRVIVLFSFSFSVLAGFGFENFINDIKNNNFKIISKLILFFVLIFLVIWGIIWLKLFMPFDKILIALSNFKLPTIIFVGFLIPVFISRVFPNKKTVAAVSIIVILIVSFDVLRFATKWMPFEPMNLVYQNVPVSDFLKSKSSFERANGNYGAELSTTFRTASIEGYNALYIRRYGEFISLALDGNYHLPQRSVVLFEKNGKYSQDILNLLGVKYIVHKFSDGRFGWTYPFWRFPNDYKLVFKDDSYDVYENLKAFDRAFLVSKYQVKKDKNILSSLFNLKIDLEKEAILEENPTIEFDEKSTGSVLIKKYTSNKVDIQTKTNGNSLLVLTDPFYNGWKAYIDGKETKIYRTDYAFRSIELITGSHSVSFIYDPDSFKIGVMFAALGILGVLVQALYLKKK